MNLYTESQVNFKRNELTISLAKKEVQEYSKKPVQITRKAFTKREMYVKGTYCDWKELNNKVKIYLK